MLCEYYIPGGRIDGVEIDLEGNIVSIYECGSGIHKGDFLDWDHWNKVLCKYLYSEKVYTEYLKKVVMLAGGYCDEMLSMANNVSNLLEKSNIEFILLKTNREENNITIREQSAYKRKPDRKRCHQARARGLALKTHLLLRRQDTVRASDALRLTRGSGCERDQRDVVRSHITDGVVTLKVTQHATKR